MTQALAQGLPLADTLKAPVHPALRTAVPPGSGLWLLLAALTGQACRPAARRRAPVSAP